MLDDREILLIANEPGISSLHIWPRNGINRRIKVNVMLAETARVSREIGAFLANIPNSKVTAIGDKVVVEGEQLAGTANSPPIVNPLGGGVPLTSSLNVLSVLNLGLNAQLNLLAQNGRATILAEPVLSARSGSKASFLAGGEFPYSVSSINGVTIVFKKYGISLDIEPRTQVRGHEVRGQAFTLYCQGKIWPRWSKKGHK